MKVQIVNNAGEIIWERGQNAGLACRAYRADGTQQEIVDALKNALAQAEAELIVVDDVDGVLNVRATTT
jgi:hypothetical protein